MFSASVLTACGVTHGESFGYVTNSPLTTVNAATETGYYERVQQLSARVYPGIFLIDSHNQRVPNTDMGTASATTDNSGDISVTYNLTATYSDGEPFTCVDFLASKVLGYQPLTSQIDKLDCTSPTTQFTMTMRPGTGSRWQELFGAGTIMPAHILAAKAGLSMDQLIDELNDETADHGSLINLWNSLFDLNNYDPATFVSYGPYVVTGVNAQGSGRRISLGINSHYHGEAPLESSIEVYSAGALPDSNKDIFAADSDATLSWLDRDKNSGDYALTAESGSLIDELIFTNTTSGTFSDLSNRQALAACIDRDAVAKASGDAAGVKVSAVSSRLVAADSALVGDVDTPQFQTKNLGTVRVASYGDSARMKAMIEAMNSSCSPTGTTIEASEDNPDVILAAVDPATQYPEIATVDSYPYSLRAAENQLWASLPTIPLAAQPRVFAAQRGLCNFSTNTSTSGLGWNMDRWQEE